MNALRSFFKKYKSDIQPVEQLGFFGDMSTPPDIQAPNVSAIPQCKWHSPYVVVELNLFYLLTLQIMCFFFFFS